MICFVCRYFCFLLIVWLSCSDCNTIHSNSRDFYPGALSVPTSWKLVWSLELWPPCWLPADCNSLGSRPESPRTVWQRTPVPAKAGSYRTADCWEKPCAPSSVLQYDRTPDRYQQNRSMKHWNTDWCINTVTNLKVLSHHFHIPLFMSFIHWWEKLSSNRGRSVEGLNPYSPIASAGLLFYD